MRELGKPEPVDADTLFMIASNTKGMTTLLLAELVDEGKLRWDEPVDRRSIRRSGWATPTTTKQVRVKHLICACTGLPRQDFGGSSSWQTPTPASTPPPLGTDAADQQVRRTFPVQQPDGGGGRLRRRLTGSIPQLELGAAYDKAMQTQHLRPARHDATRPSTSRSARAGTGRGRTGFDVDGQMSDMSNRFNHLIAPYRPAGGAWSSAADVAQLCPARAVEGGQPDGKRLVSEADLLERRKRGVPTGQNAWYGMGLFSEVISGVPVVTHGGTLQGFHSDLVDPAGRGGSAPCS